MMAAAGQWSWSVTRMRLPKISSSRAARASWSRCQDSRSWRGVWPVSSVRGARATQRAPAPGRCRPARRAGPGGPGPAGRARRAGHGGPGPAGAAAGEPGGELVEVAAGFGQGLGEADLLGLAQRRGMGQDHWPVGAQDGGAATTTARVDGQPRIVDRVYLGVEEEVITRLAGTVGRVGCG